MNRKTCVPSIGASSIGLHAFASVAERAARICAPSRVICFYKGIAGRLACTYNGVTPCGPWDGATGHDVVSHGGAILHGCVSKHRQRAAQRRLDSPKRARTAGSAGLRRCRWMALRRRSKLALLRRCVMASRRPRRTSARLQPPSSISSCRRVMMVPALVMLSAQPAQRMARSLYSTARLGNKRRREMV